MAVRLALMLLLMPLSSACVSHAKRVPEAFCILSVEEGPGRLSITSSKGVRIAAIPTGERPHEVEVSADGRTAYVSQFGIADYDKRIGTPGTKVVRIDLRRRSVTGQYLLPDDLRGPHGVKLRPPHRRELFVNAEVGGDSMLVFDTRTGRLLRRFPLPNGTHNFVFSLDGATFFSFAGQEGVSKIDAVSGRVLAQTRLQSPVRGLDIGRSGMVLAGAKREIVTLRADNLAVASRVRAPVAGQLFYVTQLRDGTILAPAVDGGVVFVPAYGKPPTFVRTGKVAIYARQAPDGLIYVSNVENRYLSILTPAGAYAGQIGGLNTPNGLAFGRC
jgi:hypothetical protein